jgi:hypothetical protein
MKKIYLSGPMKGYPESNYPLFMKVAEELRNQGHCVYNPAEFKHNKSVFPLQDAFLEYCSFIIMEATCIVMLPGHEKSIGATSELALARNFKHIEVVYYNAT